MSEEILTRSFPVFFTEASTVSLSHGIRVFRSMSSQDTPSCHILVLAVVQGKLMNIMEKWTSKFTETIKKLQGKHKYHVQFIVTKCSFFKKNKPRHCQNWCRQHQYIRSAKSQFQIPFWSELAPISKICLSRWAMCISTKCFIQCCSLAFLSLLSQNKAKQNIWFYWTLPKL